MNDLSKELPPGIHVILGDSAGGTFVRIFPGARQQLLVDRDVLCCGPTPAKPLLKLEGDTRSMRFTMIELTPFGRDVLEGRASNYPANPIDDWAGGVRLSSADGQVWFREGAKVIELDVQ